MITKEQVDAAYEKAYGIPKVCQCQTKRNIVINGVHCCSECYDNFLAAEKVADKLRLERGKEHGRKYWAERGIKVGAKVKATINSLFGLGSTEVEGIAKVGLHGAYVSAPTYRKNQKLDPSYFKLA